MKVEELREFASVMREMGIEEFSADGVTIRMGAQTRAPSEVDPKDFDRLVREATKKAKADDDAILFASSEGFPDPAPDAD